MNFPRLCTFGYALVPDDMNAPQTKSLSGRIGRRLLIPLVAVLSVCLGVIIGPTVLNSSSPCKDLMFQSPESGQPFAEDMAFRFLTRTFAYNRSFGADPGEDNSTNDAWESIVPVGQGSVRLAGSSQVYTLSVIHQLHCLWSIHQSFYVALHADRGSIDKDNPPHIRHCFDYIRQALMCSADTTLEPVDPVLGGVTGWNGTHVCRDYTELSAWAESHRVNNLRGFRATHDSHSHHA